MADFGERPTQQEIIDALSVFMKFIKQDIRAYLQDDKFIVGLDIKVGSIEAHKEKLEAYGEVLKAILATISKEPVSVKTEPGL